MSEPKPFRFKHRTSTRGIAREVLRCFEDASRWTRVVRARADDGAPTHPCGSHAVCWCVQGAAEASCGGDQLALARFEAAVVAATGKLYVWSVNDGAGLPAVRRVLRKLART